MDQENPQDSQLTPAPRPEPEPKKNRGKARIQVEVEFDLDDATVFNLNGEGIKITSVVSN